MSLDAQRAKLRAYSLAMDLDLVEIIMDEGRSAKSIDRRGLQTALSMLSQGKADAILVTKLDRLPAVRKSSLPNRSESSSN